MVVVFKDFNKTPQHINTIPVESLDAVKDWLDSVEIPFSEGPLNLQWPTIMKTVQADPHTFFAEGGWSFLATDSDEEGGSEEEEEESAFEMSGSELAEASESSEEDSAFDEDASEDAEEEGSEVSEEEGEDWDELEKKATRADREGPKDEDEKRATGGQKRKR